MTKTHEEFLRGTAGEILAILQSRDVVKGEITLLIGKGTKKETPETSVEEEVAACIREGLPRMDAIKAVARRFGLSKREVYQKVSGSPKK